MSGLDDRMLVERLINTCLVPFGLDTSERMKKLLLLFSTIDENASKAFIEVQKSQRQVRSSFSSLTLVCFRIVSYRNSYLSERSNLNAIPSATYKIPNACITPSGSLNNHLDLFRSYFFRTFFVAPFVAPLLSLSHNKSNQFLIVFKIPSRSGSVCQNLLRRIGRPGPRSPPRMSTSR